jgi:hypothetical protein
MKLLLWRGSRQSKWKHRADRWTGRTRFEGILGLIWIQTVGGGTDIGPLGIVIVQSYDSAWDKGIWSKPELASRLQKNRALLSFSKICSMVGTEKCCLWTSFFNSDGSRQIRTSPSGLPTTIIRLTHSVVLVRVWWCQLTHYVLQYAILLAEW